MFPSLTGNYLMNCGFGDIKFFRYFAKRGSIFSKLSYKQNLAFCQFGFSTRFTFVMGVSAPVNAISHIVLMCAKIKMIWVTTLSVIAFMKNVFSFRDWTNRNAPNISMRTTGNRFIGKFAISGNRQIRLPWPTLIGSVYLNFWPKAATQRAIFMGRRVWLEL